MSIAHVTPPEAFETLKSEDASILVDVRSSAEWSFVGIPDLSVIRKETVLLEWMEFPGMAPNHAFVDVLMARLAEASPGKVMFLCRSGARSLAAAASIQAACDSAGLNFTCINVAEGFEGDLDSARHRGGMNGWKAHGLPWVQS